MKLVKKIPDLNCVRVRKKGRPKNLWKDEVINVGKQLNFIYWSQLVEDRKACNDVIKYTKRGERL
jgi:hypothetical protein